MENNIKPYPHQIELAGKCVDVLAAKGVCYLASAPRSGKSLTSLLVAESLEDVTSVLVLTPKRAIEGWHTIINGYSYGKDVHVTNYEQIHKLDKEDYDFIIVDEAHNMGAYPKPAKRTKNIRDFCTDKKIMLLSGTPAIESKSMYYHQFWLSSYSPFKEYSNFYKFHRVYGIPSEMIIMGRIAKKYNETKDTLIENAIEENMVVFDGLNMRKTEVVKETVGLQPTTKNLYNTLFKDRILNINGVDIVCDSIMKLRVTLHQLENGYLKDAGAVGNTEKIDFVKRKFKGMNIAVMAHYIGERVMLQSHFDHVYSSNAHAEGCDLSHHDALIIFSQDYSGAKFTQRIDRLTNINKGGAVGKVHVLTSPGAVSDMVFEAVANKKDFNNDFFLHYGKELK